MSAGASSAIRADNITKDFGTLTVLRGVSLNVAKGEVVCVLGPSGSGKSTLLRCLNWLSPPTSGQIWIGDEPLGIARSGNGTMVPLPDARLRQQRSRIGMVFQQFNLWPHRTAIENVMEGPLIVRGLPQAAARERASLLLDKVGLANKPTSIRLKLPAASGSAWPSPALWPWSRKSLLFDEPTSALDPELVGEVLDVMKASCAPAPRR
jgi:polar amino acid transport system ATP-binding protein